MGSFMDLIPFEFIVAEFRLNLIPVIAFLTLSPLVYVPAVLFPALECFFFFFLWNIEECTGQMYSGCHIDSDESMQ